MVKAVTTLNNGRKLIVIGLSDLNLEKLREGQPIKVSLDKQLDMPLAADIAIMYGKTEEDILIALKGCAELSPPCEWRLD